MIATSLPIILSIWALVAASIIGSLHRNAQGKRIAQLERRVSELEAGMPAP